MKILLDIFDHERISGLGTGVSGQHLVPKLTFTDLCETKVKVDNIEQNSSGTAFAIGY